MQAVALQIPMAAHVLWAALLYAALTVVRAPTVWGIGATADGTNPWAEIEARISANLRNQFEWPLFFHVACVVLLVTPEPIENIHIWLAWLFVVGRVLHSGVQILSGNVRLRGIVFTANFVAVLGMWAIIISSTLG